MLKYEIVTSNMSKYKKLDNGTCYAEETSDKMIELLEEIKEEQTRVRFHWGDTKTGKDWGDTYDVKGRIGRSTGSIKFPLLVYNRRSLGGDGILTDCIVKITTTLGKQTLYEHSNYHKGE